MYPVSAIYKEYVDRRDREFIVKAVINGVEYSKAEIVDFSIENSLTLGEEFEIGTAILSKLTITLRTQDVIPPNAKVVPYLALSLANMSWLDADIPWEDDDYPWTGGVTEWLPLGEFYIDSREKSYDVWTYTCYDKLVWADVPYISALTYPTSQQAVWDEICTSLGYVDDASVTINPSYQIQAGPAGYSKRQVMGYIAGANSASVFVGKDGALKFKRFAAADVPVFDMGISGYVRVKQTNPIKSFTRFVVTYDTEDGLTYEAGTGGENQTLYLENPFMTQAMVNDLLAILNGFAYMPILMDARGYPQLEHGDVIAFDRNESTAWIETETTWQDMDLPWTGITGYQSLIMHMVYGFKGGLKMSIEAQSKSDQKSEFVVEGTLSAQVNKLNKGTVKQGKSYFGATITREDGLTIERVDHASKVILNSDKQAFQAGGIDKLYFDPIAGKYKFVGDIVMEGGSISWANVTPPTPGDIGAETPVGAQAKADAAQAAAEIEAGILAAAAQSGAEASSVPIANKPIWDNKTTLLTSGGVYTGTILANQVITSSLSAISADLGTITAGSLSAVSISGSTITGSLIQTSASYPRTVMSTTGNLFGAYASDPAGTNRSIVIGAYLSGYPYMDFNDGGVAATVSFSSGAGYKVSSAGDIELNSQLGGIYLWPGDNDYIYVRDWSYVRPWSSSITLQNELDGKSDVGHVHVQSDITGLTSALAGKSNVGHTHSQSDISGLSTTLAGKSDKIDTPFTLAFNNATRNLNVFNSAGSLLYSVNIP